jgi:hypothetical protein
VGPQPAGLINTFFGIGLENDNFISN